MCSAADQSTWASSDRALPDVEFVAGRFSSEFAGDLFEGAFRALVVGSLLWVDGLMSERVACVGDFVQTRALV